MITKYIWSSNIETQNSTSAGAFFLIAKEFFKEHKGRVSVYGCAFDDNFTVSHIRIDHEGGLVKLQGSKYVQSNTSGIYKNVLDDLKKGLFVLFSGTACQVAAVNKYVGCYSERLYSIDVLCHGVPSPSLWEKYVKFLKKDHIGKISDIRFRNKSKSNRLGYMLKYKVDGNKKTVYLDESFYYKAFIDGTSLRPSCYMCPFVGEYKYSDITLADSNNKVFHSTEAISLVLVRSEKGKMMLDSIDTLCECIEADILSELKTNKKLSKPTDFPMERISFYTNITEESMNVNVAFKTFVVNRIKNAIPTVIKDKLRRK